MNVPVVCTLACARGIKKTLKEREFLVKSKNSETIKKKKKELRQDAQLMTRLNELIYIAEKGVNKRLHVIYASVCLMWLAGKKAESYGHSCHSIKVKWETLGEGPLKMLGIAPVFTTFQFTPITEIYFDFRELN